MQKTRHVHFFELNERVASTSHIWDVGRHRQKAVPFRSSELPNRRRQQPENGRLCGWRDTLRVR